MSVMTDVEIIGFRHQIQFQLQTPRNKGQGSRARERSRDLMVRALADGFRLKHDIQSRENKRHEDERRESW
ncbi:putative gamma-glutamyl phosphate reductase [Fusarium oxysporum f. sp. albedinis]|nr:putative gamma-glutamyl phosphate reductase [Fusarium oxysporum f. sp. albedinis]